MASTTIPESWGNSPSDDVYTIKILRGDTFRGYEGFDLVDSYDESPSSKVLVFYVPKIESYGVFKEVVLRHVEMPTEDVRFWVCFNRQNGTIRPFEPVKREMVDSATMAELVSCHGTSVRIKMYLEFADDKKPPLSTHSLVFLKHFDVQRQRIYGVKKIYVHNSSKVSSLNGKINRLMRWRPARKLHLYEEIKPDRIDCLDRNKSFADSEIVNGDIICFQEALSVAETQTLRTQHPRLVLDATQFYAKMRNKSQETKYPKVPKPAIDFVVLPGQSFEDALKSLQERMDILNKDLTGYKFTCSQENDSVVAYSNFDSLMTCTICLELLVDPVSFMDCMHVTCGACAVEWFRHSSTCHQCRQPVRAVHYIHAVAATVEAYCQYNSLANRSDAELANLRAKYKPGQLIEINRREKIDSDPTAEERPMSTAGCPGCNPGNELHFLCPEPILDDAGNTMFPGHARCEDCNAHLPLMPEFSLECCAVCTRFTCRELKLQCGSASTTAPFLIQPLGTIRFPKELDTNLFETIPIKYEREVLIKYAQDYDMGAQELFTVLLELHEGAGLPRASWHGVGRAPFDRDFVSSNNLVCVTCAKDLVAGALLTWGQSIGPSLSPGELIPGDYASLGLHAVKL
ncbi:unnamed protein product [Rhizoctonia solani]|uniref:RING-type domain-containing protein n=1 Tax=Rhizoctonia solani TaxID=456999 RepID=A0A8H3CZB4_9AGAM|nr:unnamed protein product [Rhizoctonia solani]